MNYPEDARSRALAEAFYALVLTLNDQGDLDSRYFLKHVGVARDRLAAGGDHAAASALIDLTEPLGECIAPSFDGAAAPAPRWE